MHLNLVNLSAKMSVAEQESRFGILNQTAPDSCCGIRKVEPLFRGLGDYGVWFTALRREQSPTRASLQTVNQFKLPTGHQLLKVSPLADWTNADVWAYLKRRGIPVLPLYDQGYTSIGCAPCTTPRLIRTILARAAGVVTNWSAESTFKVNNPWKSFSASLSL